MNDREKRSDNIEIKMIPMLKALIRKIWLMVLVGLVIAVAVFGITKIMIKPLYRCGFTAYVNNQQAQASKDVLTSSDLVAAQHLTKTFSSIIRSNTVLTASLKSINSDLSYSQFKTMVSTEIQEGTEVISVYVVNQDPQLAFELATAIAQTAPTYMSSIVEGSSMRIVDYPEYSDNRYRPSYFKYALLGFFAGVLLVIVILVIRFIKDDTVNDEATLENQFNLPVLGIIPDVNQMDQKGSGYQSYEYRQNVKERSGKQGEE